MNEDRQLEQRRLAGAVAAGHEEVQAGATIARSRSAISTTNDPSAPDHPPSTASDRSDGREDRAVERQGRG